MHIETAKQFLAIDLAGFISRNFSYRDAEDPDRFEPLLKRYLDFVKDPCPYWVQEKTLHILTDQNSFENELRKMKDKPSPEVAMDLVIERTRTRLLSLEAHFKTDMAKGRMAVFMNFPRLPK